jgi:cytochrome b561
MIKIAFIVVEHHVDWPKLGKMVVRGFILQKLTSEYARYDGITRFFHWSTAVLVVEQWLGAQAIDLFPRGALRVDARSLHILLGALLGVLLVARLYWRLSKGRRLPAADAGLLHFLAKATHYCLYGLLLAMVAVGLFLAWTRGDSLFNVVAIPIFSANDHALAETVQGLHATIGWLILGLAGLHAAAALVHHFVWRDGVLARMLPGRTARRQER